MRQTRKNEAHQIECSAEEMIPTANQGLIVIPDISGYTAFLYDAEIGHAQKVVSALLETLIETNRLDLELCEIEGDALLFFRIGALPPLIRIMEQATHWHRVFHSKLKEFKNHSDCHCGACTQMGDLALKVVVHFGEIGIFTVGTARKLFGKDVTLAHRLLKNTVPWREYLLLPQDVFEKCNLDSEEVGLFKPRIERYPVYGDVETQVLPL